MRFKSCLAPVAIAIVSLACTRAASAQNTYCCYPLPDAIAGTPYTLDLFESADLAALVTEFQMLGIAFTYSFSATGLPPGITMAPNGVISGTPTQVGTANGVITFNETFTIDGMTSSYSGSLGVTLTVDPSANATQTVFADPDGLTFALTQGSAPQTQAITLTSTYSSQQSFTASASLGSGHISVTPSTAQLAEYVPALIDVAVDPTGLSPGTYSGSVTLQIAPDNQTIAVPVNVTVQAANNSLSVSQTGLFFTAVQGGSASAAQSYTVSSGAATPAGFTVTSSTNSGGNWLTVTPSTGATSQGSNTITVTADPGNLAAGVYYGQISVAGTGIPKPAVTTVVMNVSSAAQSPGLSVSQTGFIFVGTAASNPAPKTFSVVNPSPAAQAFSLSTFSASNVNFFSVTASATSAVAKQPATVTIQPLTAGLANGVYQGEVDLQYTGVSGTVQFKRVQVILVVISSGAPKQRLASAPCGPSQLFPVFTQLGQGFSVFAGWPVPLEIAVVDDCGNMLTNGGVSTTFSDGDQALAFSPLGDGRWDATWNPIHSNSSQVTITATAQENSPNISGTASLGGGLQINQFAPPVVGGVVSAASFQQYVPAAPGSFLAIFGAALSSGTFAAQSLPLETQLGGTIVTLGGEPLALQIAQNGQINAIVPYDIPPNSQQQIVVFQGNANSTALTMNIASAQPAVFTQNGTGTGPGSIFDYTQGYSVDSNHPAHAGDILEIYCSGLGPVDQPLAAGAAPATTTNTMNPVTVTIGNLNAPVLFAGLAPGFAGLYQINATLPSGIAPGTTVPVVVSVAGQNSPTVTLTLQ